jgi:hypothetical protein
MLVDVNLYEQRRIDTVSSQFATEMVANFTNMCRLCMGEKDSLLPLFDDSLPERITTLVPVLKVSSFVLYIKCPFMWIVRNIACIVLFEMIPGFSIGGRSQYYSSFNTYI